MSVAGKLRLRHSRVSVGVALTVAIAAACGGKIVGGPGTVESTSGGDDDVSDGGDSLVDGALVGPGEFSDGSSSSGGDSAPAVDHCSVKAPAGADCYEPWQASSFVPIAYLPSVSRRPGKCSDNQINFVVESCLGGGNCSAAVSGAGACGSCMFSVVPAGAPATTTVGPLFEDKRGATNFYTINAAGCFDVLTGIPGCGSRTLNRISCKSGSCCTCSDQAAIDACQAKASASTEPCTGQLDDACRDAVISSAALATCLAASLSTADTIALGARVAAVFCK